MTFSGLVSRCTTPGLWAYASAPATPPAILRVAPSGSWFFPSSRRPTLVNGTGATRVIAGPAMPRRAPVSASAPPAPGRGMRTPSISRVFAAALLAIAVAGLVERWATWQSARRTQADMIDLTHRLERIAQLYPSPGIETQLDDLRELAAAVGDDAIQAAIATTILFAVMLVALGVGLWFNRRRLAQPFAHLVSAPERVAAGP